MKQLWIATMIAWQGTKFRTQPGYVIASSEGEALGEMLLCCQREYPSKDGWSNHQVGVGVISTTTLKKILAEVDNS